MIRQGRRGAACVGLAVVLVTVGVRDTQDAVANGDTRTLSFSHLHTDETATVTFKREGRYDEDALKQLNWLLRDWRRDESTKMDPRLFDIVWEVYRETGASKPIRIVSAYRSPATNSMLRARGRGVAKFSQHMEGRAMDFYIPDVDLDDIRAAGLRLQRGGVGWYPSSGSPFVHLDTGTVRHWPRMSRDQLARVFPDGKTVHLPADGRPLSGYDVAAREVEQRGGLVRGRTQLAAARSGADDEDYEADDNGRMVYRGNRGGDAGGEAAPRRSLFAWLTGDAEKPRERAEAAAQPAAAEPDKAEATPSLARVPLPVPRPADAPRPVEIAAAAPVATVVHDNRASVPVPAAEAVEGAPLAVADVHAAFVTAGESAAAPALRQAAAVPPGPPMRWVTGPAGRPAQAPPSQAAPSQAAPSQVAEATLAPPLPRPRPGRATPAEAAPAAAPTGGGFALASMSSRPAPRPVPAAPDTTASVARELPAVITDGTEPKPQVLAYAVPGDAALPRATAAAAPAATVPSPTARAAVLGPAPAPAAAAPATPAREGGREATRLVAPRVEGPGLPRLITAARFGAAAVDFRHPDQKGAAALLRAGRAVLDLAFSREPPEPKADQFDGPAIRALPLARFDVAAR